MSTLQISLAVGGLLILLGLVIHSAWSARKNLPKQPTPKSEADRDAAQGKGATPLSDPDGTGERQEPRFDADAGLAALAQLTAPEKKPSLDALIDAIAPVALDAPVSGEAALAAMPATRRVGSKPFAVEGLNVASGEWEFPAPNQRYSVFQCGIQLANRTGALNQIEYSEFVMKTQSFVDAIGGVVEFAEMQDEVARARELDQFTGGHDAQLGLNVRAVQTPWSPGYVQQNAAGLGFVPTPIAGRMVLPASVAGHGPILGLSFDAQAAVADAPEQTALREISLSLDVPQVARSEKPFARMCEVAIALAGKMDGVIVDDDGNPIRPQAMETIHADLEQLYDRLEARELSAGSVLGRRVFS